MGGGSVRYKSDESLERIVLYNGAENMLEHADHLAEYFERLSLLMTIRCNAKHALS